MTIKYKDFYHYMIKPETRVVIIDNQMKEIYRGKGFLIQDDLWNKIKDKTVLSAGLSSEEPEFIIWIN